MRIKNNFTSGITNSDVNYRSLPNGTMVDAENFFVTITGGSDVGLGKNPAGNVLVAANNFVGGKSWGAGKSSANNKVYYFVKARHYDYLMEYDSVTNANVIVLQSTTGARLNLKEGERITNIDVFIDPEGNGNLIFWSGDSNPPRCGNIERMKTWGLDGFTAEEILVIKAPPVYSPILTPTISLENSQSNYLSDKFICFATRYKYKDGYFSCNSSWSEYFFIPKKFEIDFETFENLGMVNSFNAVLLDFETGSREVVAIQVVFKFSNEVDIYEVDTFVKSDEGWSETVSELKRVEFNNAKSYKQLPKSEYFRSFDNVPEIAIAQSPIGNRISYGNYKEGKNLIDKNGNKVVVDYSLQLVSNNVSSTTLAIQNRTVDYTYQPVTYSLVNGQIDINLAGINLIKGSSIVIYFKIKSLNNPTNSPVRELVFNEQFPFILDREYTSLADLIVNSFLNQELLAFTSRFEANGGVVFPLNYVPDYEVLKPFLATSSGDILSITFPVIKYEIDVIPDPNVFLFEYFFNNNSIANYNNIATVSSLKSYRSYEIAQIYRDLQGRKTTALTSTNNTIFIPNENAITQNIINVNIPITQKPPTWANTYKFAIKRNKGDYEVIPINIFFVDGLYRYILLEGENKNKVKDGDILLIKRDGNGFLPNPVRVKVLEVATKETNFISNDITIIEPAGLYFKIKVSDFLMEYKQNEFIRDFNDGYQKKNRAFTYVNAFTNPDGTDRVFQKGSTVRLFFNSFYHNEDPFVQYDRTFTAQLTYNNFIDFWNNQIAPVGFTSTNYPDKTFENIGVRRGVLDSTSNGYEKTWNFTDTVDGLIFVQVQSTIAGNGNFRSFIQVTVDVRSISGLYIFENTALEINNELFYETPEIYNVINGEHEFVDHLLTDTYNCFCQGNGIESYQIRDAFNEKSISIDFSPTAVSEDQYGEVNRYADITYSGIYNSTTNLNKLNEFNLSLANFKDDLDKSYGAIIKLRGKDTDLEVYQEDRVSTVLYGKNILTSADGSTQVTQIEEVLNQQNTFGGENGISVHSESFDFETFNEYFTDVKRGAVCKKSNNGIFEISNQGQKNYFRKLFRDNTINNIIGAYDLFHDYFILNIKYNNTEYVTWVYSDLDNGFLGKIAFNPEDMIRINNDFISLKDGNVYKHNQEKDGLLDNFNTFYGTQFPSKFSFVVNDEPTMQKIHKAISMESTDAWDVILETNLNSGYINKEDFEKQEGVFYGYIRNQNLTIDTAIIGANSGIGNCTVNGLVLEFSFNLEDSISIGDEVINTDLELVGTILNKTINSLSLNTVNNVSTGDFVLCSKPQSVENNNLVGHSMLVTCTIDTNKKTEVFTIGTEVVISSPT